MVDAKKELGQIAKGLAVLTKRTEKLAGQLGKLENTRVQGSKQERSGKPQQKETSKIAATTKKDKRVTAIDTVLDIIKKRKAGVTTADIKEQTGYAEKKIWDIINRGKRQGVVKSASKGLYVYVK